MTKQIDLEKIKESAKNVRLGILEATHAAGSGHPGGALGIADILTYLYAYEMNVDPKKTEDPGRDRFVLSAAHMVPGLYAVLAETGFIEKSQLKTFREFGSPLQGHTFRNLDMGVEVTGGSLGQGLSIAIGFALAARLEGMDYRSFCIIGDGEINEGSNWEALMFATKERLDNLCVILDRNNMQQSNTSDMVMPLEPLAQKLEAFNWYVHEIDGHDFHQIQFAFDKVKILKGKPTIIIANTVPGKGVSFMENNYEWHGVAPDDMQYKVAVEEIKNG